MNKKFLSFLALGLLMSSSIFAADADPKPRISARLEAALTDSAVDWSLVHRTLGYEGDPDAATVVTTKPTKKSKRKGKRPQVPTVLFEDYYAPLAVEIQETEQTVETMKALLDQYQLTIRPLTKAKNESSKKNPFNKDSQNKLGAYEKAVKQVRAIIQNLKQNSGTAAAAKRTQERAEAEVYLAKVHNAKSEEEAAQRAEEARQRRAIGTTPARAIKSSDEQIAITKKHLQSIIDKENAAQLDVDRLMAEKLTTRTEPIEFPLPQAKPYEKDTIEIYHLVADYLTPNPVHPSASVHACPACGKVNDKPCTIRIARNQEKTDTEIETTKRHQKLLSDWVKIALDPAGSKQGFDIGGRHASGSPIYDLFCDYAREIQRFPGSLSGHIGLTADKFHDLLKYKFEHVE